MKTFLLLVAAAVVAFLIVRQRQATPPPPPLVTKAGSSVKEPIPLGRTVTANQLLQPLYNAIFERQPITKSILETKPDLEAVARFIGSLPERPPQRGEGLKIARQLCATMQTMAAETVKSREGARSIATESTGRNRSVKEEESRAKTDAYFAETAEKKFRAAFAEKKTLAAQLMQRLSAFESEQGTIFDSAEQAEARTLHAALPQ